MDKEQRFLQLINDIDISNPVMDFDQYGNKLFWFDGDGNWVCDYNLENGLFWFNYFRIWSIFEKEYGLNYDDIHGFMKTMVEKHFKFKGVTPRYRGRITPTLVEKHFKFKGVTPGHRYQCPEQWWKPISN